MLTTVTATTLILLLIYALPLVDESKATIKVKSDNCELRVKIKII